MRFAEKMMANAKSDNLMPYSRHNYDDQHCALGLVEKHGTNNHQMAETFYPWLKNKPTEIPCFCVINTPKDSIAWLIAHLFNEHVMQGGQENPGASKWSMKRLAAYIDGIDPTPRPPCVTKTQKLVTK